MNHPHAVGTTHNSPTECMGYTNRQQDIRYTLVACMTRSPDEGVMSDDPLNIKCSLDRESLAI